MRSLIASAALLFCISGAAVAAEAPACATVEMAEKNDAKLLTGKFTGYEHVLVADLTGNPAKNALFIMVKMGAPQEVQEGARVVIWTGHAPAGSGGDAIGDAHLYVFDAKGCMMGGTAIPLTLAQSFAGLGA